MMITDDQQSVNKKLSAVTSDRHGGVLINAE